MDSRQGLRLGVGILFRSCLEFGSVCLNHHIIQFQTTFIFGPDIFIFLEWISEIFKKLPLFQIKYLKSGSFFLKNNNFFHFSK